MLTDKEMAVIDENDRVIGDITALDLIGVEYRK
jgi:hypothetical protein